MNRRDFIGVFGGVAAVWPFRDAEAYRVEGELIGQFHKAHAGQLWNTIDERFLDPS